MICNNSHHKHKNRNRSLNPNPQIFLAIEPVYNPNLPPTSRTTKNTCRQFSRALGHFKGPKPNNLQPETLNPRPQTRVLNPNPKPQNPKPYLAVSWTDKAPSAAGGLLEEPKVLETRIHLRVRLKDFFKGPPQGPSRNPCKGSRKVLGL